MQREVQVKDFMELVRRPVAIDPTQEYVEIGVQSFGRGIFHKEPISGATLGSKRVFEIHPDELVFNTVFAWEGAVATTSECETGTIGSHRFMTYQVDPSVADIRYLYYFFQSEAGLKIVRAASPGSAGRNRTLGIKAFAGQYVPLPDLEEQRRIATKLDSSLGRLHTVSEKDIEERATRTFDASVAQLFANLESPEWSWQSMSDVAEINPRRLPVNPEDDVAFVPMSAVDEAEGCISNPYLRKVAEVKSGYTQFCDADVIFARITPCMQNGKTAIFEAGDPAMCGYGSSEFHVVRPRAVSSRWIHAWMRRKAFRDQAAAAFTGTAGQQRVPASFVRDAPILVPPSRAAEEDALARVDEVQGIRLRMRDALARSQAVRKALRPALLNAAFSGRL